MHNINHLWKEKYTTNDNWALNDGYFLEVIEPMWCSSSMKFMKNKVVKIFHAHAYFLIALAQSNNLEYFGKLQARRTWKSFIK